MPLSAAQVRKQYPEIVSMDQLRRILHFSKRKTRWMLDQGWIPCKDSGKKTRRFQIKREDIILFLEDYSLHPEKYPFPPGQFTSCQKPKPALPAAAMQSEAYQKRLRRRWKRQPDALTRQQVAGLTGYSLSTVDHWFRSGRLQSIVCRNVTYCTKEELIRFLSNSKLAHRMVSS